MIIQDKDKLKIPCRLTSISECRDLDVFNKMDLELKNSPIGGLGLAANQIGLDIRACTIHPKDANKYKVEHMINPRITDFLLPMVSKGEGCLSFPGVRLDTNRFEQITCTWIDYELGEEVKAVFFGLSAIVCQHEVDHLSGLTIWDRRVPIVGKVGRNDPCPKCFRMGLQIKYKRCKEHFPG